MEPLREGLFEIAEGGSGYLLANACEECGVGFFPSRTKCTRCFSGEKLRNIKLSQGAKLYTYTTVYRAPAGFNIPYLVGYVDFEKEGIRVFAQLTGCKPEDLEVGMEMELVFEEMGVQEKEKRKMVYKFRPMKCKESRVS